MEVVIVGLIVLATAGASYGLGRSFGGSWMLVFVIGMVVIGGGLLVYGYYETGPYPGLGAALILMFVWAPVLVCGLIGAAVGWGMRGRAVPPDLPSKPMD